MAYQPVFTCRILLEKTQCLQLLEVMRGDAWAAESESSLNGPDPDGFLLVQAEDVPVDSKCEPFQLRLNDPVFLFLQESSSDSCGGVQFNLALEPRAEGFEIPLDAFGSRDQK